MSESVLKQEVPAMDVTEHDRMIFCQKAVCESLRRYPEECAGSPHRGLGYIGTYSGMVADHALRQLAALREEIKNATLLSDSQLANQERLTEELESVREENIKLLNDASVWRNRAIGAEEEIREGGRGIDLRRGFER